MEDITEILIELLDEIRELRRSLERLELLLNKLLSENRITRRKTKPHVRREISLYHMAHAPIAPRIQILPPRLISTIERAPASLPMLFSLIEDALISRLPEAEIAPEELEEIEKSFSEMKKGNFLTFEELKESL